MIKVSVLYPSKEGSHFDIDYYCHRHMAMVKERLGDACKGIAVDKGLAGEPGQPAPYMAIGHLFFDSVEAFQRSFDPHVGEILADIPNYTNVEPILQVSQVAVNATRSHTGDLHLHRLD